MSAVLRSSDGVALLQLYHFSGSNSGIAFRIKVNSRGFCADAPYNLESFELPTLIADLKSMHSTLKGAAELRIHSDPDGVRFEMDSLGRVKVSVTLMHWSEPFHQLQLGFYSDQSCLPSFISELTDSAIAAGCTQLNGNNGAA
jgi:hypothetical protein